jgi:hypothetical protein
MMGTDLGVIDVVKARYSESATAATGESHPRGNQQNREGEAEQNLGDHGKNVAMIFQGLRTAVLVFAANEMIRECADAPDHVPAGKLTHPLHFFVTVLHPVTVGTLCIEVLRSDVCFCCR